MHTLSRLYVSSSCVDNVDLATNVAMNILLQMRVNQGSEVRMSYHILILLSDLL